MKYQILFSEKNKDISKCRLLKILPSVLSAKFDGSLRVHDLFGES